MNTTKLERKNKAIEFMKKIKIFDEYIKGYKENNDICLFEMYAGFWAYQYPELIKKKEEIEEKYNCTVYAITHEITEIGEFYDFLVVTDHKEEWDTLLEHYNSNNYYAFSYVWNVDDDYCSEFGTIWVKSIGGGLRRIA